MKNIVKPSVFILAMSSKFRRLKAWIPAGVYPREGGDGNVIEKINGRIQLRAFRE
jgi:hypothetical protein